MFTEEVVQENNLLKITISIKKRVYAYEKKIIHDGSVEHLIPPRLVGKVKLISAPQKKVSNMSRSPYVSTGTWIYEIVKTRKTTRKTSTTKAKDVNIDK